MGERTRTREPGTMRVGFAGAKLQRLEVKCANVAFEPVLDLPHLRELSISVQRLESLPTTVHLPELAELAFEFGYGDGRGIVDFASHLPKLHVLRLHGGGTQVGERLREILSSKILSHLSVLDLRDGSLAAQDLELLIENAPAFVHLERLDLRGGWLHPDLLAALVQVVPNVVAGNNTDRVREEDDEDEDEDEDDGEYEGWGDPPPVNEDEPPEDEDEPIDEEREDEPRGVDLGAPAGERQLDDDELDL